MQNVPLATLPASEEIRRKAAEVLQREEFRPDSATGDGSESLVLRFIRWVLESIQRLADALDFLPDYLRYPFLLALVAILLYMGYRIMRGIAGAARVPERSLSSRTRQATAKSPEEYESLAAEAMREGRVIEAVRLLFQAGLLRIEQAEKRPLRPGITNRELLRRYRTSAIQEPLRELVETIDMKWYGGRPASSDDFERCQAAYGVLRQAIASRVAPSAPPTTSSSIPNLKSEISTL
jgi:hypothetical protein